MVMESLVEWRNQFYQIVNWSDDMNYIMVRGWGCN
jgi:hypothetical protein